MPLPALRASPAFRTLAGMLAPRVLRHLREEYGQAAVAGWKCVLAPWFGVLATVFEGEFAKLHPYFKRCASGSERERHCARILREFRENTVAPYTTLPYGSRL